MAAAKRIIWQDIKDMANELTEEQLQQPVRWWGEQRGGKVVACNTLFEGAKQGARDGGVIDDANVLDEDYVSDGEAYSPKSCLEEEDIDENDPVVPAGTVMLWMDI